jgi:hypothetical protein
MPFVVTVTPVSGLQTPTEVLATLLANNSIGEVAQGAFGRVTTIKVRLFTRIRAGQDLTIYTVTNKKYRFTVSQAYEVGVHDINITNEDGSPVLMEVPVNSFIVADPVFEQAEILVSPGEIAFGVDAEAEQNAIARLSQEIPDDTPVTALPVSATTTGLLAGAKLVLSSWAGSEIVTVSTDTSAGATSIPVTSFTPQRPYDAGDEVSEAAWAQSGRITTNSNQISLLVTEVNGLDTSLAGLALEVGEIEQETTTFRQTGRFAVTNDVVGFTGLLSTAVSGTTTSLEVGTALDFDLIVGDVLRLAPGTPEQTDVVVATAISGGAGNHTIAIDSIALPPIGSGAQIRFAEGERSELQIFPLISLQLYSGQRVLIGAEVLTLSANYTLVASTNETIAFNINTPITLTTYMSPSFPLDVFEPGVEISTKTSVIGARAVLQTDVNGNLAEVSLFSGPTGSNIKIKADFIVLEGQTTFLTDFYKNLSATSFVIVSDTAPDERPTTPTPTLLEIGDVWINTTGGLDLPHNWNGTGWIRGFTVVDAGNVTTGTLNANNVTIRASDSATTFVEINSGGITGKADDVVNFYLPNNTTDKPILKNFKLDRILIERRGADDEPNQIVFSGSNFFGLGDVEEGFEMGAFGPFLTIFALENFSAEVDGIPEPARGFIQLDNELSVRPLRNFLEVGVELPDGWTRGVDINNRLTVASDFDTFAQGKIYFRFNGSSVEDEERYFVLRGLPNSATGLPSGALWNDSGTIKIA